MEEDDDAEKEKENHQKEDPPLSSPTGIHSPFAPSTSANAPPPPSEVQPSTSAGAPFTSNNNDKKKKIAARDAENLKNKGKKKWMIRKKPMSMILMKKKA
jgi:hypothetical protein